MLIAKVNPATGDRGARQKTLSWRDGAEHSLSQVSSQAIRAELAGSDRCSALGITISSSSPVLALCRDSAGRALGPIAEALDRILGRQP